MFCIDLLILSATARVDVHMITKYSINIALHNALKSFRGVFHVRSMLGTAKDEMKKTSDSCHRDLKIGNKGRLFGRRQQVFKKDKIMGSVMHEIITT